MALLSCVGLVKVSLAISLAFCSFTKLIFFCVRSLRKGRSVDHTACAMKLKSTIKMHLRRSAKT